MVGAQDVDRNTSGFRFSLARLSTSVLDGDDGHAYFLGHRATMNELRSAREVEPIGPFRYPVFHAARGVGGREGRPVPHRTMLAEVAAEQVSLLGQDGACGLVAKRALVRLIRVGLCEQESVIGGHEHMASVEVVRDVAHEVGQFVDGLPNCGKGLVLCG